MSDSDSFIDEVSEEVRRDRLFAMFRRYGWIGVLVVVLVVGGASWREFQKARDIAAAQDLGDAILAALEADDPGDRITALRAIEAPQPEGRAVLQMLLAAELAADDQDAAAADALEGVATNDDLPEIYRQIASFKALVRDSAERPADERRLAFEALARPGQPLRLLAAEQLALIDIETGDAEAAIAKLNAILDDSEVTPGLRQRATQLIVALGGELDRA